MKSLRYDFYMQCLIQNHPTQSQNEVSMAPSKRTHANRYFDVVAYPLTRFPLYYPMTTPVFLWSGTHATPLCFGNIPWTNG